MATNPTEEIIEKRDTSPLASSCLAVSILAILGAIALQIAELSQIRADWSASEKVQAKILRVDDDNDALDDLVKKILKQTELFPDDLDAAREITGDSDPSDDDGDSSDGDSSDDDSFDDDSSDDDSSDDDSSDDDSSDDDSFDDDSSDDDSFDDDSSDDGSSEDDF